jgi:hypothetical protein
VTAARASLFDWNTRTEGRVTIELNLSGVVVRAIRNCELAAEVAVVLNCLVDLDDKNDLSMCVLRVLQARVRRLSLLCVVVLSLYITENSLGSPWGMFSRSRGRNVRCDPCEDDRSSPKRTAMTTNTRHVNHRLSHPRCRMRSLLRVSSLSTEYSAERGNNHASAEAVSSTTSSRLTPLIDSIMV